MTTLGMRVAVAGTYDFGWPAAGCGLGGAVERRWQVGAATRCAAGDRGGLPRDAELLPPRWR